MGVSLRLSKKVDAPIGRVFEVFTDLRRAPERISGIKSLEVLTEGPIGVGTKFRETRVMFGREATEQMEITEFRENEMYAVECTSGGTHFRFELEFRPDGAGTMAQMSFDGRPVTKTARALSVLTSLMMKGACRRAMEQDLADLKRAAESAR